jgi:hypothetical protein
VSRIVDHGKRGVRVVVEEVSGGGVSDRRVQPPCDDQSRTRVCRPVMGGQLPSRANSFQCCLVDERCGRGDRALVSLEHLRGLDHEVASESVVADLARSSDDPVLWDVAYTRQQGTDERKARDVRRLARCHRLRVVAAWRVTNEKVRSPVGDLVGEAQQRIKDVVGATQQFGSHCLAHTREVGIDPPQPRNAVENRLEAGLSLAVMDAGAVEHEHWSTVPVLHVVDHYVGHSYLHLHILRIRVASPQIALTGTSLTPSQSG